MVLLCERYARSVGNMSRGRLVFRRLRFLVALVHLWLQIWACICFVPVVGFVVVVVGDVVLS